MITFPNAKINLGLNIVEKRPDGYHNLETIFYPINLQDALEVTRRESYGNHVLHTFRYNKFFFILLKQICKSLNHLTSIPPSASVQCLASSVRNTHWWNEIPTSSALKTPILSTHRLLFLRSYRCTSQSQVPQTGQHPKCTPTIRFPCQHTV